jgi:transcriptional regulator
MLGEYDENGLLVRLIGHMSRRRSLHRILEANPATHFLFTGPQGYVSAEHSGRRSWGPTWNYAAVRVEAEVRFDAGRTAEAVARLAAACEAGRAEPWQPAELGSRYEGMLAAIIGFEARVITVDATFKLGQDEDDQVLGQLAANHPDPAMREWIRALNPGRLG